VPPVLFVTINWKVAAAMLVGSVATIEDAANETSVSLVPLNVTVGAILEGSNPVP
jgi:hypothetical protein